MNLTIEQFEKIEAYLNNNLSETEKVNFELSFIRNMELQEEINTYKELRLGLQALAIEKKLANARKRFEVIEEKTETKIVTFTPVRNFKWQRIAVAASFFLVIGSGFFYKTKYYISSDAIAMTDQEMSYKSLPIELPNDATIIYKNRILQDKAQYFLALTYIKKGNKQKAKKVLKLIISDKKHLYFKKGQLLLNKL